MEKQTPDMECDCYCSPIDFYWVINQEEWILLWGFPAKILVNTELNFPDVIA